MTAPGTEMQALFRAARRDGPSSAAKERMFAGIAAQTAGAAAATSLLGKLLGSSAAKVGAVVLSVAAVWGIAGLVGPRVVGVLAPGLGTSSLAPGPDVVTERGASESEDARPAPASFVALSSHAPRAPGAKAAAVATSNDGDAIEREARWVAEARTALMRGEPALAAAKARAARALPSHMFEPEELRILGRALRVMGDDVGADAAFSELVAKYPAEALRP